MTKRLGVGVLGASRVYGWGGRAHVPAIKALPEFELVAVGTSRPETAATAADQLGARFGYHDYRSLIDNPEVDIVVVSVKAPLHHEITVAALNAGKAVFTEWPLGANLDQAEELAALAKDKGLPNIVGLQARVSPAILRMKNLISEGYIGRPLSCSMTMFLTGRVRDSINVWEGDRVQGGNTLTIHLGHSIDALCFCLGNFSELSAIVQTQTPVWHTVDTDEDVHVDSPDTIMVNGVLDSGCLVSIHVASTPGPAPGWRMQVYGTEGSLVATSTLMLQYGEISLRGARETRESDLASGFRYDGEAALEEIEMASTDIWVPPEVPNGPPFNVAQLYRLLSDGILKGSVIRPDFDDALANHRLLHTIEVAAESGTTQKLLN